MAEPLSEATRELGRRIRAQREAIGKSQERLADLCGLHWTFVGQVERGRRNLSFHNLLKLAEGLGVDAGDLVRGLHAPPPAPQAGPARADAGHGGGDVGTGPPKDAPARRDP